MTAGDIDTGIVKYNTGHRVVGINYIIIVIRVILVSTATASIYVTAGGIGSCSVGGSTNGTAVYINLGIVLGMAVLTTTVNRAFYKRGTEVCT